MEPYPQKHPPVSRSLQSNIFTLYWIIYKKSSQVQMLIAYITPFSFKGINYSAVYTVSMNK